MSMRYYGVETKGLVMTKDELHKLILKNDNKILRDVLDIPDTEDINEYYDNDYYVDDFVYAIDYSASYYDISGNLCNIDDWEQLASYYEEDIIITELEKDTLYDKYNSFDEIKQELKNTYKQVGIELDDEFIEKHFGKFSGVYWG